MFSNLENISSRRTFEQVTVDVGLVIRSALGEKEFLDILDAKWGRQDVDKQSHPILSKMTF